MVSRIQQVANAFRVFECDDSGQALQTRRIEAFREAEVMRFVEAVALRTFGPSSAVFHASDQELGAVLSVPCRDQQNLPVAQPA